MQEFEIISKYFKKLSNNSVFAQNLGDDSCYLDIKDNQTLVISKDLICEDSHFKKEYGGYKIAYKLLAANLSDLAACGAKPIGYMLGFCKNNSMDEAFIANFCQALSDLSQKYNLPLIGGDTISSKSKLFFSITIFGSIKQGKKLLRSTAQDQDLIFISGNIGDSYLGLQILEKKLQILDPKLTNYFLEKHFYPTAQINLGQKLLSENLAHSAIDISDGLFADLDHICQNSQLEANIFLDKIAFSKQAQKINPNYLQLCQGGEDYELIFTAKKKNKEKILQLSQKLNVKITEIGFLKKTNDNKINLFDKNNKKIAITNYGYEH